VAGVNGEGEGELFLAAPTPLFSSRAFLLPFPFPVYAVTQARYDEVKADLKSL